MAWEASGTQQQLSPGGRWVQGRIDTYYYKTTLSLPLWHRFDDKRWRRSTEPKIDGGQVFMTAKCMILELPAELLVEIVRDVIPTNQTFHVYKMRNNEETVSVVHRLSPLGQHAEPPKPRHACNNTPALASVCKELSEMYYAIFYRENRFFIDMGESHRRNPRVKVRTSVNFESWSRLLYVSPSHGWPITTRSLRYIRYLGLHMPFPVEATTVRTMQKHCERLRNVLAMLPSDHQLKRLTIETNARDSEHAGDVVCTSDSDEGLQLSMSEHDLPRHTPAVKFAREMVTTMEALRTVGEIFVNGEQYEIKPDEISERLDSMHYRRVLRSAIFADQPFVLKKMIK